MIKRKNGKKKGFSLIELIIVLAVMAIIALIAIPNFTAVKDNAKAKSDVQSANAISRSVESLIVDESISLKDAAEGAEKSGTIVIKFTDNTPTATITGIKVDNKVFKDDAALKTYVEDLLKGQSGPQQKGKNGYEVTIDKDGKVSTESKTIS